MIQRLYWLEPEEKWRARGYANNVILNVNYERKTFEIITGMIHPKESDNNIEVKNKGCLRKYVGYLKKFGFKQMKN